MNGYRLVAAGGGSDSARLRERLFQHGSATLSDSELVATLLSNGQKGATALEVAERLLRAVGGVPGLERQDPEVLFRRHGLSRVAVARLVAALALSSRRDPMGMVKVGRTADLVPVFRPILTGLRHERLAVAVVDRACRVLAVRAVTDGSTDGVFLPIRDIMAAVLRYDGHAFAIAHNHPSGDPTPSEQDRAASRRCAAAAETAGLRFYGHVVLGAQDTWASAHPSEASNGIDTSLVRLSGRTPVAEAQR
ncbi:MAG TPA: JAB domain-containing protein [Pseudonocardiaceae bacterium]